MQKYNVSCHIITWYKNKMYHDLFISSVNRFFCLYVKKNPPALVARSIGNTPDLVVM